jgi:hypothetical protein
VHFEIVGTVTQVELIANGRGVRRLKFLRKRYGRLNWRKVKGLATIRLATGAIRSAELHLVRSPRHRAERVEDKALPRLTV